MGKENAVQHRARLGRWADPVEIYPPRYLTCLARYLVRYLEDLPRWEPTTGPTSGYIR